MITITEKNNIASIIIDTNEETAINMLHLMEDISCNVTIVTNGALYDMTLNKLIDIVGEKLQNKIFPNTLQGAIDNYKNIQAIIENEDIISEENLAIIIRWIKNYYSILTETPETSELLRTFIIYLIDAIASCPDELWYRKLSRLTRGAV